MKKAYISRELHLRLRRNQRAPLYVCCPPRWPWAVSLLDGLSKPNFVSLSLGQMRGTRLHTSVLSKPPTQSPYSLDMAPVLHVPGEILQKLFPRSLLPPRPKSAPAALHNSLLLIARLSIPWPLCSPYLLFLLELASRTSPRRCPTETVSQPGVRF